MNAIELALKKQRLELDATAQREALAQHAAGLTPLFDVADQVNSGVRWVGRHPEVVAGILALLLAARPGVRRFAWRWGRRSFVAWRLWRNGDRWLNQPSRP
ncbi:MAG: YqjK-like family protein [Gammaproteobacteria bacterium]|nr:hypothetical protein [Rhodocyclaceae bacterium]MBU3907996.1 YqjK-like family protein [Gammaproteobacteria bacterium]MBU3990622.1 YqjK-like family protein [Gammaproteobacteria bacterium]MBU4006073.1 YqjK-like family protein [Gammaproteobacteria bacterium]MBU4022074.1 YqjK-like family protein [Gammaproteobacteria bacterium]